MAGLNFICLCGLLTTAAHHLIMREEIALKVFLLEEAVLEDWTGEGCGSKNMELSRIALLG